MSRVAYVVMSLITNSSVTINNDNFDDIPFKDFIHGAIGVLPVFDDRESAEAYSAGRYEVVKIKEGDRPKYLN